ncbi:MAG: hypothetical protein R3277_12470, partial [Brumimicrobium sp.]|nr:hypothetical protein [Brumimicrobium sp.]
DLENRINIEGMNKGDVNPLEINITYNGYNVERVKVVKDKKKRKVDGVEYVDTVYYGRADVKHPLMLYARSPIGSDYAIQVPQTDNFKTLKTSDYSDSAAARKNIVSRIEEEEKTIGITNLEHVNRLLNSQFGTQDIQYFVNIYTFESTSKNDYSDLQEASLSAQLGLKLLNTDPNSAYEKLNKAYSIWSDALNEYSPGKKARINDKVKKGILLNLTAVSIFTENWEGALKHITELENMKLSSAEKGELNRLRGIYRDLKSRYDALAQ